MSQNYSNHKRFHKLYHFVFVPLTMGCLFFSFYTYFSAPTVTTALLAITFLLILFAGLFARMFSLKAQDRAIRAEEKLRYFILAGKSMPNDLRMGQILALRFASDEEFLGLVDSAVSEKLSSDEIKKSIKNWRGDYYRI